MLPALSTTQNWDANRTGLEGLLKIALQDPASPVPPPANETAGPLIVKNDPATPCCGAEMPRVVGLGSTVKVVVNGVQAGLHGGPDGSRTLMICPAPAAPGLIAKLPVRVPLPLIEHGGDETLNRGGAESVNVHPLELPNLNPPPVKTIGAPIVP
jgi:hypothetical protein